MAKPPTDPTPTVDDYIAAAHRLATLVRKAFDSPHSVKRSVLKRALEKFERIDIDAR